MEVELDSSASIQQNQEDAQPCQPRPTAPLIPLPISPPGADKQNTRQRHERDKKSSGRILLGFFEGRRTGGDGNGQRKLSPLGLPALSWRAQKTQVAFGGNVLCKQESVIGCPGAPVFSFNEESTSPFLRETWFAAQARLQTDR